MAFTVRRIRPDDGERLKTTRLAALLDSPAAFSRTYAEEADLPDDHWARLADERSQGSDHCTIFVVDGDRIVGLVGGHRIGYTEVELVSMWTDPVERGRGIGAALVDAILNWAAGHSVGLWVMRDNNVAQRLYESCGFVEETGYEAAPTDPCRDEIRMLRTRG